MSDSDFFNREIEIEILTKTLKLKPTLIVLLGPPSSGKTDLLEAFNRINLFIKNQESILKKEIRQQEISMKPKNMSIRTYRSFLHIFCWKWTTENPPFTWSNSIRKLVIKVIFLFDFHSQTMHL